MSALILQVWSIAGALLVLTAYACNQRGIWRPNDLAYQGANFVGAAVLTTVAVVQQQAGFIVLEGAWALISLVAFTGAARRRLDDHGASADARERPGADT